jgi:hypothetical protein
MRKVGMVIGKVAKLDHIVDSATRLLPWPDAKRQDNAGGLAKR